MHAGVTLAVLQVTLTTRVGETKILRNAILTISFCLEEAVEIFYSTLFKRDTRNVTSGFERYLIDVGLTVVSPGIENERR